jgi:hypothetical protein
MVGVTVAIPPCFGGTLKLVNGECDTFLVSVVGEVQLGLDHPQPVIGLQGVFGVAESWGLQADEPLDLALEVFFRRAMTVGPVVPLLN